MTPNHWCVFSAPPACLPSVKLPPAWLCSWSHSPHHTHFFFFFFSLFLQQRICFPGTLPTLPRAPYLPTDFKFHDQVRKRCILSQLRISSPHTPRFPSEDDSFNSLFAMRFDFHNFFFLPGADKFCNKHGSNSNIIPMVDNFHGLVQAEHFFFFCSGFALRLSEVCWGNVAPLQPRTSAAVLSPISPGVFPRGVGELNIWQRARRGVTPLTCAWF